MTRAEWLRLKPYCKEIRSNPRGGWSNLQGRRTAKGKGKGYGAVLKDSRIVPTNVRFIRARTFKPQPE